MPLGMFEKKILHKILGPIHVDGNLLNDTEVFHPINIQRMYWLGRVFDAEIRYRMRRGRLNDVESTSPLGG